MPVMNLRWGREGYLASAIFPTFEHVPDITGLPKPIRQWRPVAGLAWQAIDTALQYLTP
jgi:hypothetical protein